MKKYGKLWMSSTSFVTTSTVSGSSMSSLTPSPIAEIFNRLSSQNPEMKIPCKSTKVERPKFLSLYDVNRPASRTPSPSEEPVVQNINCSKSSYGTSNSGTQFSEPLAAKEYDPLACFSLYSNGLKLSTPNKNDYNINSIDGIKVLTLLWVIIANACLISETSPAMNYISIRKFATEWPALLILNSQLAADTFIVCTGALLSFNFLKDMRLRGIYRRESNYLEQAGMSKCFLLKYVPLWYLHRYIRLTPVLGAIILLQVTLLKHMGSGPFWTAGSNYITNVCSKNWWSTLLYVGNYLNPGDICLSHSWYLMVDMQLYILSPLFVLCLLCWNLRRILIVLVTFVLLGNTLCSLRNLSLDLPAGFINEPDRWLDIMKNDYMSTLTRLSSWMIGMFLGYVIYQYHLRSCPEIPKWFLRAAWIVTPLVFLYPLFGLSVFQQTESPINSIWSAMYNASFHCIWAIGISWIVLACEMKHGGIVRVILHMKIFRTLSRLTYTMYLIHMPLMMYRAMTVRFAVPEDQSRGISLFVGDVFLSIVLAILLTLLIEIPMKRLLRVITMHCN
ncbi:hypothetical protein L9F63_015475, partial [Diploptera punctata]